MLNSLRGAPYYDDYDSTKQYTQLLAIPGRVAQAREITQIQSTMKDIIKSIGDSILRDGNIIEGCQVLTFTEGGSRKVRVTPGKVYINGMVLPVAETIINIAGTGTETVGVKLVEEIITEAIDNTLRDPAQGYANHTQPGCNRLKSSISVVINDPDSSIISTIIDGSVAVESYAPEYDVLTQTLANRTYEESGSYIVEGFDVRTETNSDNTKFNVVVEPGIAYIKGYRRKSLVSRKIAVPRATTYIEVSYPNGVYLETQSEYQLEAAPYVKSIVSAIGEVSTTANQTISANTDAVLLDELNVKSITSVTQGGNTYTIGTSTTGDCYLQRVGTRYYVKWNGTASHPIVNTGYTVTYIYEHTFIQDTDYELSLDTSSGSHNLHWISGGSHPMDGGEYEVLYEKYLARKDIVHIDQEGNIAVTQGTPAEYGFERLPEIPVDSIPLASIMSPPGGSVSNNMNLKILTSNIGLTRFTMDDIQDILKRVRTLEYDQALLSLNDEARQHITINTKKGIFTDPLIDLSKIDYYYNVDSSSDSRVALDNTKPIYDATIDLQHNLCYLPTDSEILDAVYDTNSTTKRYSRNVTLASVDTVSVLSQLNATRSFLVNPYSMFPQLPEISVDPSVDVWIEPNYIDIHKSQTSEEVVETSTRHIERTSTWQRSNSTSNSVDTAIGTRPPTTSVTSESVVSETAMTYIRPREVKVEGSLFPSALDNIKCYFDGVYAPLTPTGTTAVGTEGAGTIKAGDDGTFTAKFTIPNNILSGIREIRIGSDVTVEGYETSAIALYQGAGTLRTIQRTITTLTTVLLSRVTTVTNTTYIDPVGQTFVLDRMTMVSGIDLYFESKPSGSTPVVCDIREVVNGVITSTIYGHKSLNANDPLLKVSSDGSLATRFIFDDPVLLEANKEYAFVVRSTSPSYRIWIATIGDDDIISGETVLHNPYLIGNMMSSSNNSSWTVHQTSDIKFNLLSDVYSNSAELFFNEYTSTEDFSRVYLLAESIIPAGTSINWKYSTDSGVTFEDISPYNIEILDQMKSKILLKAILNKENGSTLSPIISLDSVGSILSHYITEGYYITNTIPRLDEYDTVEVILNTHYESNTGIEVYVLDTVDDSIGNATKATLESTSSLGNGWSEQVYKLTGITPTAVIGVAPEEYRCKVFIKMTSSNSFFTPAFQKLRVIIS